jgi:hypothetical protein
MKKVMYVVFLGCLSLLFQSCISSSSLQTARTVGKGNVGVGFGVGIAKYQDNVINYSSPMLDFVGKYGVSDNFDIGARLSLTGTAGLDAKYQFLGDDESKFAASIGGGFGFVTVTSGDIKTKVLDLTLPTYFSYHPKENFAIYLNPQLIQRHYSYSGSSTVQPSINRLFYGGALGFRLGGRNALFVEYSYIGNSAKYPQSQFTLGYGIGIR